MSAEATSIPAAIPLGRAALCLDCDHIVDGEAGRFTCTRCSSEALLWLQGVLDRHPGVRAS